MEKKLITFKKEVKAMNLNKNEKEILCRLLAIADDDGWCYITIKSLANELNYSKTNVLVITKLLENKKIITQRIIGNRCTRTRFKLNLDLFNISSSSDDSSFDSHLEDAIRIKIDELKNEIDKLNNLAKIYIASNKNSDDFKFELKMIVSHKNS